MGGVTKRMVPARSRNNHRGPAFFHFLDSKAEDISSWQRRSQKSARTCPAFAFPQRERNIAVSCAKRRGPTRRKSPAIVAIRLARSEEHPNRKLECRTQSADSLNARRDQPLLPTRVCAGKATPGNAATNVGACARRAPSCYSVSLLTQPRLEGSLPLEGSLGLVALTSASMVTSTWAPGFSAT